MKRYMLAFAFALFIVALINVVSPFSQPSTTDDHTQWVASILKEMQSIKVGMKRVDLLKVFKEEGGVSTRLSRRYAYRDCPYIKVDVEFKPVGEANDYSENPQDRIVRISKPFLEWEITD